MTRKDSEKETDRPHYYSQFWLDVAAGRTVIGAAKSEDETDLVEDEADMSEPELGVVMWPVRFFLAIFPCHSSPSYARDCLLYTSDAADE